MSVSKVQRESTWNVEVYNHSMVIAGLSQRADLLHVADIAHELSLCMVFQEPDDDTVRWQPALLRMHTPGSPIILDRQDDSPFPTPPAAEVHGYTYIFHSSECARPGDPHSLQDNCILVPGMPTRRFDPRYLEIGGKSTDERHAGFPTRTSSQARAPSLKRSASSSRTTSLSPSRTETTVADDIPSVIASPDARRTIKAFPSSVFQICNEGCVITGKGILRRLAGPGLEAAHIVPQSQWNTFPIDGQRMADPGVVDQLQLAWRSTWSAQYNGIMLLSHLHKCFNTRLIAIHPKTHLVRAFVDYDAISEFHGVHTRLPRHISEEVLQHHWDMCCLENTPGTVVVTPSGLGDIPELLKPKAQKVSYSDPSKQISNTPSFGAQASDTQASETQASDTQASDTQTFQTSFHQSKAYPPSLPLSERALEERTLWPFRKISIKGTSTAKKVMGEDEVIEEIDRRGRSREKKRCLATEESEESDSSEQRRDGIQGIKRRRLGLTPDDAFTGL